MEERWRLPAAKSSRRTYLWPKLEILLSKTRNSNQSILSYLNWLPCSKALADFWNPIMKLMNFSHFRYAPRKLELYSGSEVPKASGWNWILISCVTSQSLKWTDGVIFEQLVVMKAGWGQWFRVMTWPQPAVCCSVLQAAVGTGDCCIVCCWAAVALLSQGSDGLLTNFLAILIHGHGSNNARLLQICTNMHMSWTTVLDRKIRNDKKLCLHFPCIVCPLSVHWVPPPHPLTPSPPSHA